MSSNRKKNKAPPTQNTDITRSSGKPSTTNAPAACAGTTASILVDSTRDPHVTSNGFENAGPRDREAVGAPTPRPPLGAYGRMSVAMEDLRRLQARGSRKKHDIDPSDLPIRNSSAVLGGDSKASDRGNNARTGTACRRWENPWRISASQDPPPPSPQPPSSRAEWLFTQSRSPLGPMQSAPERPSQEHPESRGARQQECSGADVDRTRRDASEAMAREKSGDEDSSDSEPLTWEALDRNREALELAFADEPPTVSQMLDEIEARIEARHECTDTSSAHEQEIWSQGSGEGMGKDSQPASRDYFTQAERAPLDRAEMTSLIRHMLELLKAHSLTLRATAEGLHNVATQCLPDLNDTNSMLYKLIDHYFKTVCSASLKTEMQETFGTILNERLAQRDDTIMRQVATAGQQHVADELSRMQQDQDQRLQQLVEMRVRKELEVRLPDLVERGLNARLQQAHERGLTQASTASTATTPTQSTKQAFAGASASQLSTSSMPSTATGKLHQSLPTSNAVLSHAAQSGQGQENSFSTYPPKVRPQLQNNGKAPVLQSELGNVAVPRKAPRWWSTDRSANHPLASEHYERKFIDWDGHFLRYWYPVCRCWLYAPWCEYDELRQRSF